MFGRKVLLLTCLLVGPFAFSEFIDGPSFYGNETIYNELKANWPAFTHKAGYSDDGKPEVKYVFDGTLQYFPCGPLKAWLVAYRGSNEICIYHFINNDGTNTKQTNQSLKSTRASKGRYKAKIEKNVNSLLPRFGVNRFDIIVGVNGVLFSQPHPTSQNDGEYGPIYELAMALEKGQSMGGIRLMLKSPKDNPKAPPRSIIVKLKKLPPFSKNYPEKCRRSAMIESEILDILAKDSENPKLSNNISWGMIGMAMLASGRKKYLTAIENYAMLICNGMLKGGGANTVVTGHQDSSWKNGFHLMFLSEYFWATGDMEVFPVLQRLAYDADEYHHNILGGAGHGAYGRGTYWSLSFGPPCGVNALGASLAEKAGAKINNQIHEAYWNMLTNTTLNHIKNSNNDYQFVVDDNKDYFTSYGHNLVQTSLPGSSGSLQNINTSLSSMALWHSRLPNKNVKKLSIKLNDNLIYNYKIHSYIHTTPMMGSFFTMMSLNMFNNSRVLNEKVKATFNGAYSSKYAKTAGKKGNFTARHAWRRIMDYQKYLLILSRVSKDNYLYFIPRKQNGGGWGGDSYARLQGSALYCLLNITVSNRRNLLMYGNKRRNWLVAKNAKDARRLSKVTLRAMSKYHNIYSNYLLKQISFLMKGGKDQAKVAAGDKKLGSYYLLMAYKVAQKIIENYRGYPAYKKARKISAAITSKFGGRKMIALHLKNLKGLQIIDYVTVLQARANMKQLLTIRKGALKLIQNTYLGCPVVKIAAEEYKRTERLEELELSDKGWYSVEDGSEFDKKVRIPRLDIKDVDTP